MRQGIIAAISTPPGKGGVALIRISGTGAHELAREIFVPIGNKDIRDYPERHQIYGYIICNGERCDDGMLTLFKGPRSYTGEDMAEICCHGGVLITRTVLGEILARGAMPAERGEFTRRAFVNGKLSLTEAEGIGNLLEAVTDEQIRLASAPARTALQNAVDNIRKSLTDTLSSIYARIDYPEEDLGEFSEEETLQRLSEVRENMLRLYESYKTGKAISEGIRTVITGKPNAGKSTLYNLILGEEAAIVTDIAGTTRDLLSATASLGRVTLNLTDTAGIRNTESADAVEKIGIKRSCDKLLSAELIIAVFDLSRKLDEADREILDLISPLPATKIAILNKSDSSSAAFDKAYVSGVFDEVLSLSVRENPDDALVSLTKLINRLFTDEKLSTTGDAIISSVRQHSALRSALGFIDTAIGAYKLGMPVDAASSDIELALGAISELDGRAVAESVTDGIFAKFCVGK